MRTEQHQFIGTPYDVTGYQPLYQVPWNNGREIRTDVCAVNCAAIVKTTYTVWGAQDAPTWPAGAYTVPQRVNARACLTDESVDGGLQAERAMVRRTPIWRTSAAVAARAF